MGSTIYPKNDWRSSLFYFIYKVDELILKKYIIKARMIDERVFTKKRAKTTAQSQHMPRA